jgi:hypothetical protein
MRLAVKFGNRKGTRGALRCSRDTGHHYGSVENEQQTP